MTQSRQRNTFPTSLMICFLLLLCVATPAYADDTNFQLQRFRPWSDPQGILQTQSASALGQWRYAAGLFLNYSHIPLSGHWNGQAAALVDFQLSANVVASIGFLSWLDLYVDIPVTLFQAGQLPKDPLYGNLGDLQLTGTALSDIRVGAKVQALSEKKSFLSLSFLAALTIPSAFPGSGDQKLFHGDDGIGFEGSLLLSKKLWLMNLAFNLGYRFAPASTLAGLTFSHELTYSLGASLRIIPGTLDLLVDLFGNAALQDAKNTQFPFEIGAGVRWFPIKDKGLGLTLAGGAPLSASVGSPVFRLYFGLIWSPRPKKDTDKDGLTDDVDGCPKLAGPGENKGCPWEDSDKDGLTDNIDKCPKVSGPTANKGCPWKNTDKDALLDKDDKCPKVAGPAENKGCPWKDTDKDGLTDNVDQCPKVAGPKVNKGCPEPDRDKDGVVDRFDQCPNVPGLKEKQGCPKKVLVKVTKKKIEILQKVYFAFGKADIATRSFDVLNQIVQVLKSNKSINIRVEGHTDDVGSSRKNKQLSEKRAKAVREFIIRKGISDLRVTYKGFGESKPLIKSTSKQARAKNRRVEFTITQR